MNKLFSIIILSLFVCINSHAENHYYYYYGEKVPLTVDESHVVAITPKQEGADVNAALSSSDFITVSDSRSDIKVYNSAVARKVVTESSCFHECYTSSKNEMIIPNGYIYIKLKQSSDISLIHSLSEKYHYQLIEQNDFMPLWYTVMVRPESGASSVSIANQLYETGLFASCCPSFSIDAREISYDPDVYTQWNLYNPDYEGIDIDVSKTWSYSTGRGIKVAVIDEGIDREHIDLKDNIDPLYYNTETKTADSEVYGSHGTHCAGIIGAVRNNGVQISGVAPDVSLISVSSSLSLGSQLESNLADGINWAWKNGADIISCSWHCRKNPVIKEAIENATTMGRDGKGCVFVKSAGNTTTDNHSITYLGNLSEDVIAVSNIMPNGLISPSSCYGPNLLVCAPGTDILSTLPYNKNGYKSGTSMACPHVSGVAALILSINPALTAKQVREIIAKSAKKVGNDPYDSVKKYGLWNYRYGYGLVDAYNAVLLTPRF